MNYLNNKSISKKIVFSGKPLHSKLKTSIILNPLTDKTGIFINNLELNPLFITDTAGMTTHGNISQIEHLLSSVYALGINNLNIEILGNELPVLDGCSEVFITNLKKNGITELSTKKKIWFPNKNIEIKVNDSYIKYTPWLDTEETSTEFVCKVDFPYVGKQEYKWNSKDLKDYENNICNSKTFFWDIQFQQECIKGKCLGVDQNNCIIYNKNNNLNNNELAKHKLLDLIGDLNTLNMLIPGRFVAYKPGHKVNNIMARKLWSEYISQTKNKEKINFCKLDPLKNLDSYLNKIRDCHNNFSFVRTKEINILEKELSDYAETKYAITCNSGTSALELAILSLDLKNEKIMIPDLTFWATYEAVKNTNNIACIIGVETNFQIDFEQMKKIAIIQNIKCAIIVHMYGYIHPKIIEIRLFCKQNNIYLIEDGSQCFGSKINGKGCFSESFISGVSLYPSKVLGANGNAGVIFTNNYQIKKKIEVLRDHGRNDTNYNHTMIGCNKIMNTMQAIYLSEQLKMFPSKIYKLNTILDFYNQEFKNLNLFKIIELPNIKPNGYLYPLRCQVNNILKTKIQQLSNLNIDAKNIYPSSISQQPGFDKKDIVIKNNNYNICSRILCLPIYNRLTCSEIQQISNSIHKIDKLNVVIIGHGRMGQRHKKEILKNNKFNLIGIIDPISKFEEKYKINSIKEAREKGAEVAIIASSTKTHFQLTHECLHHNLHVLVEKPAFLEEKHFKQIMDLSQKKNLSVSVGMVERYNPNTKKIEDQKKLKIKSILVERICPFPNDGKTGLLVYDLLIHDLDLIDKYFGKIEKITHHHENNTYYIKGYIGNIFINIKVGYSNIISNRKYTFEHIDLTKTYIDMVTDQHLLEFEHNDWFNYLVNNKYNISTLQECYNITKQIMSIESNTYNKNLQSV